jgi:predicted nucleic acid-binding protein
LAVSGTIVPNASIAVELLLRTPIGENLARRLKGATLVAPALIDCEVLAMLRKLVLKREIRDDRAGAALDDLSLWQVRGWLAPFFFAKRGCYATT